MKSEAKNDSRNIKKEYRSSYEHRIERNSKFSFFLILRTLVTIHIYIYIYIYTGCPRRNVPDFGRVFLMLMYTDITQKTYIQS